MLEYRPALLRGNTGIPDDAAPSFDLELEQPFERCGRRLLFLNRRHTQLGEAADQVRILDRLLQGVTSASAIFRLSRRR